MGLRTNQSMRAVRHQRLRKKLSGSASCPRLSVYRSLRNIAAQLIDDSNGVTLCSASSLEKAVDLGGNKQGAAKVGELIAHRAKQKGIKAAVFDRGGYRYAGRVAELAESARKAGLEF